MRIRLLWKLLAINVLVIALTVVTISMAIDYIAADYYADLMRRYKISPSDLHMMFLEATRWSLVQATLFALVVAVLSSYILTKIVLRPLGEMIAATEKIGVGEYDVKLRSSSLDEFGELAVSFRQMADSLRRLEQLRKKTMIDVAHGLRTPLTNMRGYLEALSTEVLPPSKETFHMLHDETLRLVKLVESLLQLARADAAGLTIRRQDVDLGELILQACELFQLKFEAKRIQLTMELGAAGRVMADAEMISQACSNLLDNAVQYTEIGGKVRLKASRSPGQVTVSFANSGEAIPAADLALIFERFHRVESVRGGTHGGAGVGLTIVKELVEAHGGSVGASSTAGETTIWFTLPD